MRKAFKFPGFDPKRLFKAEDSRFILSVGLKVSGISFVISLFIYYLLYLFMRLNYAFFKANGFPELEGGNPFYSYVIGEAMETLPALFAFHVCLFFIGTYIGWLILRPFRSIGEYSEKVLDNLNTVYKVEDFSTYKLLTRFSEFFFEYLRESRKKGEIISNSIPPQFSRIHRPVQDKVFLLHFGLLLVIISISSAYFIIEMSSAIYYSMVDLATKTLANQIIASKFFSTQMFVLDELVYLTIFFVVVFYTLLGFHLYSKVSGAAFGIFSTMRSFMKGDYGSRVHLVGYAYLREHTRKLNKYLDYVEKNFGRDRKKD